MIGLVALGLSAMGHARYGRARAREGIVYAVLTGGFIAAYTLWDTRAVTGLGVPPVLLDWTSNLFRTSLLGFAFARRRQEVRRVWRRWKYEAVAVALLAPLAYILVLTALESTPVSYVAPARELSIGIGAILGVVVLREGDAFRRLCAAAVILVGVVGLALG